jgi:hypothetical protein
MTQSISPYGELTPNLYDPKHNNFELFKLDFPWIPKLSFI